MKYADREGRCWEEDCAQDRFLRMLYTHAPGRLLIKLLIQPWVSRLGGAFLNSRLSCKLIPGFVRNHKIDLSQYEDRVYRSYNDFFTRQIKKEFRPAAKEDKVLISPCDGKLSVYPIDKKQRFPIKHTEYSVRSLLRSGKLAKRFEGGTACVFRLTVDDYHHYCYVDDGIASEHYHIPGVLHTVNPIANDEVPVYKENSRAFCLNRSRNFGLILTMEVGAMMVGKIHNFRGRGKVKRGSEMGCFEFGGSTVILLLEPGRVEIDGDLIRNTARGMETVVKMGEKIGRAPSV
ncbi:phosphatidylserine decarboxylase [Anaerolentibacter hominis]|uniref:phosphatidylserine decarboxylase n=1 Tax=Anaerolentibacter hominis TaxID=3079009 RepID=UPI0031B7FC96